MEITVKLNKRLVDIYGKKSKAEFGINLGKTTDMSDRSLGYISAAVDKQYRATVFDIGSVDIITSQNQHYIVDFGSWEFRSELYDCDEARPRERKDVVYVYRANEDGKKECVFTNNCKQDYGDLEHRSIFPLRKRIQAMQFSSGMTKDDYQRISQHFEPLISKAQNVLVKRYREEIEKVRNQERSKVEKKISNIVSDSRVDTK